MPIKHAGEIFYSQREFCELAQVDSRMLFMLKIKKQDYWEIKLGHRVYIAESTLHNYLSKDMTPPKPDLSSDQLDFLIHSTSYEKKSLNLRGASLRGLRIDLHWGENINFEYADLSNTQWIDVNLINCKFKNTKLDGATFKDCHFSNTEFSYSSFRFSDFQNVGFINCKIYRSDFVKAHFNRIKENENEWIENAFDYSHSTLLTFNAPTDF